MRRFPEFLAIAAILLFSVAFCGRAIFAGKIFLPADILLKELPWRCYSAPSDLQNHYVADVLHIFYPMKVLISERLGNGQFPLWLPEVSCGYPLFASGFHDVISFSGLLLLLGSVELAHNLLFALELFLAGTSMYLYMRTIRIGLWGALISAVAFMLNFLFMCNLLFEHIVGAMLWLPLICLFIEKFYSKGKRAHLCLAGLFIGVAILNGSIQSMLYIFIAAFIYVAYHTYRSVQNGRSIQPLLKGALVFALIALIGISISAVKIAPTFEFLLGWNERSGGFSVQGWLATLWKKPLAIPFLSGAVFPDLIGSHRALDMAKILGDMGGREAISGETFKAYIGIFPLIFALIAILYRRCERTKLFIWMSLIPVLLILFTPLYLFLYFRGFVILVFAGSVLAGLGADWLISSENRKMVTRRINSGLKKVLIIGIVLLVAGNILLYAFKDRILTVGHRFVMERIANAGWLNFDVGWQLKKVDNMLAHYSILNHRMYLPFLIGVLCLISLWAFGRGKIAAPIFMSAVILITFFDLARLGWDYIPVVDKELAFPETESIEFLKQDESMFRVRTEWDKLKEPPVFPSNTLLPYGISDIRIYASLIPQQRFMRRKFDNLLNVKYVLVPPRTKMPQDQYKIVFDKDIWIYENLEVLPRAYMVHQARFVETREQAFTEMQRDTYKSGEHAVIIGSGEILHSDAPVSERSDVKILNYAPTKVEIDVNTETDGFLVLSDRYYPGWKVSVDGNESRLYNANYTFRAAQIDAGQHRVCFTFAPFSFRLGLYVSVLCAIATAAYICITVTWGTGYE